MKVEKFNQYFFTRSSQYQLDEWNYVVAVKEDSRFSNKNIRPLYYMTNEYQILAVDPEDIGERILVLSTQRDTVTEDISTRFSMHELFKIIRGPLQYNDRHELDYNVPKIKIYKNYLEQFAENEVIEIFDATIDVERSRVFIKNPDLRDLISKKYVDTSQVIMCFEDEKIVGPFNLTKSDSHEHFIAKKSPYFKFGIHKINDESIIDFEENDHRRRLIYDTSVLENSLIGEFDFLNDRELVYWFENEILNKRNTSFVNSEEINSAVGQIERLFSNREAEENKQRYDRLYKIFRNTSETLISKEKLLVALPEFRSVKDEIDLLEKRRLELKNDLSQRYRESEELESRLSEGKKEVEIIRVKIEDLKSQHQIEQNKIREDIKSEITALEQQKDHIQKEIEEERINLSSTLDNLKEEIKYQEKRKSELETGISALKKEFTSEQRSAHEKLSELVKQNTHFNFISGRELPSEYSKETCFKDFTNKDNAISEYILLRSQLSELLKSHYRYFDNHFIDNLLISIHQNTLTLFAGLPGTGKTSLAKILTSALAPAERIREIPVARGWTSQKDLIGFSNPLSKTFYESQTGLYSLLKQLNYEWDNNLYLNSPLAFAILDEANLSPLEHYWSIFYNATDTIAHVNKPLVLNLGQSEMLSHANTLRFIGTINYDQTTEELSPRILDRTNIIRLMPQQFQIENFTPTENKALNIRFRDIIEMFGLLDFNTGNQVFQIGDLLTSKYEEIKEVFEKLGIYISPRIELGIKKYCQVASTIMTEELRPLDYCVAQRLLPLINVQGNYRTDLENLLKKVQSFNLDKSISANILKNIIQIGNRSGYTQDSYNYFLTLTHV